MKIRIASDLHLELCAHSDREKLLEWVLPPLDSDKSSVLVLPGDIINFNIPHTWETLINYVKDKFKAIIIVPGNHEFYNSDLVYGDTLFREYLTDIENIYYLRKDEVKIDDVLFVGCTLWTNFNNNNPNTKIAVQFGLNDYNYITYNNSRLIADNIYQEHRYDLDFLTHRGSILLIPTINFENDRKTVVLTHHLPSLQCIHPKYKNSGDINYGFASDLDWIITSLHPALWISGHTHTSYDFNININNIINTRLIANPLGYSNVIAKNAENKNFNNRLVLEI